MPTAVDQALLSPADKLAALPKGERDAFVASLPPDEQQYLLTDWAGFLARPNQRIPEGKEWAYWAILAGRGYGKTRAGAETCRIWARGEQYVNLIGATSDDAKDIMIEGESGILACCPTDERPTYKKHERKLTWPSGCQSLVFTADEPDRLRGKQHSKLWGDEIAAWRYPEAWDQAKFGLRLGDTPQAVVTTTPRPTRLIRELVHDRLSVVTTGSTYENAQNLPESWLHEILQKYEGTRLGRQELLAEILADTPGALWTREGIDTNRIPVGDELPKMRRVVVAIDPAISTEDHSNETGMVVVAAGEPNEAGAARGMVLEDASGIMTPDEWARRTRALVARWNADAIVAERNQGGNMVEHVIRSVLPNSRVVLVHASQGKYTRAEPAAALYEQGRVSHVGRFDALEDQMVAFTSDIDRKKQGYSPDRVDALVWALTDLFPQILRKRDGRKVTYRAKRRFTA
ncbi:MAG: DNA-packaging protein [Shimia sp.]|nr:DNA-packaging protein [Shimia sp.]